MESCSVKAPVTGFLPLSVTPGEPPWVSGVGSLLFVAEQDSTEQMDHSLFNHLPVEGHLKCFSLGLINKAALNIQIVAET